VLSVLEWSRTNQCKNKPVGDIWLRNRRTEAFEEYAAKRRVKKNVSALTLRSPGIMQDMGNEILKKVKAGHAKLFFAVHYFGKPS